MNFEQTDTPVNPLDLFKDKVDEIKDLGTMESIYQQMSTRTSKAPPEAREYVKQRLDKLTQEDTVELNPIRAIGNAVHPGGKEGLQLGLDQLPSRDPSDMGVRAQQMASPMLSSIPASKSAIGRGVDKGVGAAGGIGLALLSASEGWRGKPLTEAMHLDKMGLEKDELAVKREHNQAQMAMEARKLHDSQRKELMDLHKTYGPRIKAMVRTGNEAGLSKIENELSGLYGDKKMVQQVMSVWKANPTNFDAFMEMVKQGKMGDAWDMTNSLGEDVDLALKVLGDPKHVAAIRNAAHALKPKDYPPMTDDERKAGGLQTKGEKSIEGSEVAIKAGQATNVPIQADKLQADVDKAKRELSQQDLEEYTKLFGMAMKQAGGGGSGDMQMLAVALLAGKGGAVPEMGKVDKGRLAEALRDFAETAPGISDKTKLALHKAANRMGGAVKAEGDAAGGGKGGTLEDLLDEEKRRAGIGGKKK